MQMPQDQMQSGAPVEAVPALLSIEVSLSQDGSITVTSQEAGAVNVKDANEAGSLVAQLLQNAGKSPEQVVTDENKAQQAVGYQS